MKVADVGGDVGVVPGFTAPRGMAGLTPTTPALLVPSAQVPARRLLSNKRPISSRTNGRPATMCTTHCRPHQRRTLLPCQLSLGGL